MIGSGSEPIIFCVFHTVPSEERIMALSKEELKLAIIEKAKKSPNLSYTLKISMSVILIPSRVRLKTWPMNWSEMAS
jgi:hypothetical protein